MRLIEKENISKNIRAKLNEDEKDYTELEDKIANEIDKYILEKNIKVTNTDDLLEVLEDFISDEIIYYMDKTGEELTFDAEIKDGEIKVNVFSV